MLALVLGPTKFHQCTYRRPVTVITDHQLLVAIVKKSLDKAPRRPMSMLLRIQEYDYNVIFKPGKSIPVADALSRAPFYDTGIEENMMSVSNLSLSSITYWRLVNRVESHIRRWRRNTKVEVDNNNNNSDHKSQTPHNIRTYFEYRDELTHRDASHAGINSCIRRPRQYVFWPGMSSEIRKTVEICTVCNSPRTKPSMEPRAQHNVSERPWEKVGTDLFYHSGKPYHSRLLQQLLRDRRTSGVVINKLKGRFARHGIPDTVISENGPQFASRERT